MELLKKAINSIFESSYPNIEVILVFQGIDNAIFGRMKNEVGSLFPKKMIHFVQHKTTTDERSKNLNLGLAAANGDFIAFLDDDDFVAPVHYENLIAAIRKNNSSMAFCIAKVVDEKGNPKTGLFKGRFIDKLSFYKDNFITINSFVVTRKAVERLNLKFDERLQLAEDYLFLLPLFMNETASFVHDRTCYYRIVSNESQSFTTYEQSGERAEQYALLKTLRRPYKPSLFQKLIMLVKRRMGLVYKVA